MKALLLIISTILVICFTLNAQVENKPKTKDKKEKVKFEVKEEQPSKFKGKNTLYDERHKNDTNKKNLSPAIREEKKKK